VAAPNRTARAIVGKDVLPLWSKDLPRGGRKRSSGITGVTGAVYFQACVGTMFGPAEGGEGVAVAFQSLAKKAGIGLVRPEGISGLCCGTPWKSKGMLDGYHDMVARTTDALWEASDHGRLPVVCDNSSCSEGLVHALENAVEQHPEYHGMRIVDAVDFAAEHFLEALNIDSTLERMVVHPTCSSTRAGSNGNLAAIAAAVSAEVTVPVDWGCCAFAGDRGMLHPELTASATSRESAEVAASDFDAYVSCNRTCEIGMTRATGRPYQHILEVLDAAASASSVGHSSQGEAHV
jgi:D-lactate dehydrogenase